MLFLFNLKTSGWISRSSFTLRCLLILFASVFSTVLSKLLEIESGRFEEQSSYLLYFVCEWRKLVILSITRLGFPSEHCKNSAKRELFIAQLLHRCLLYSWYSISKDLVLLKLKIFKFFESVRLSCSLSLFVKVEVKRLWLDTSCNWYYWVKPVFFFLSC